MRDEHLGHLVYGMTMEMAPATVEWCKCKHRILGGGITNAEYRSQETKASAGGILGRRNRPA